MPMRQEPAADRYTHDAKYEQFITDYHAWQDHEGHTAEHEGGAGGHAADDHLERRPHQRGQAKHKQPHATQTMPLRLESLAPSSRAVSFCAAPSSVRARVSSRSTTGIGELRRKAVDG